ncbi:hypothetical protein TNIN_274811 [Trichonephila inaurata madagascariensis]|uniref:Uncharacterized protein n=1 Tax=Trichonephila inaurata madagascariensis TaxID=2747483 RepID=A0A8X6X7T7_9ARAC|nr:hypothetical protein TNIN_274811 [Trichonephila inaurata madagascariensis]
MGFVLNQSTTHPKRRNDGFIHCEKKSMPSVFFHRKLSIKSGNRPVDRTGLCNVHVVMDAHETIRYFPASGDLAQPFRKNVALDSTRTSLCISSPKHLLYRLIIRLTDRRMNPQTLDNKLREELTHLMTRTGSDREFEDHRSLFMIACKWSKRKKRAPPSPALFLMVEWTLCNGRNKIHKLFALMASEQMMAYVLW